jgi:hypothetical protein
VNVTLGPPQFYFRTILTVKELDRAPIYENREDRFN